jgi:phosphatidylglycerophosphate synthase
VGGDHHPVPRDPGLGLARVSRDIGGVGAGDAQLAKWKTVLQMVAIGFLLAGPAGDKVWPYTTQFGLTLLWIAALLTLYTGYDYLRAAVRHAIKEA